jgi:hypothetical protein
MAVAGRCDGQAPDSAVVGVRTIGLLPVTGSASMSLQRLSIFAVMSRPGRFLTGFPLHTGAPLVLETWGKMADGRDGGKQRVLGVVPPPRVSMTRGGAPGCRPLKKMPRDRETPPRNTQ